MKPFKRTNLENSKTRIAVLTNYGEDFLRSRKHFLDFVEQNYQTELCALVPKDNTWQEVKDCGYKVHTFPYLRSWTTALTLPKSFYIVYQILKSFNCHILFTYKYLPNIIGIVCGRLLGVPFIVSTVAGLGKLDPKVYSNPLKRLLFKNYLWFLNMASMVIVQNEEDFELLKSKLSKPKIILTAGSGINKKYFEEGIPEKKESYDTLGLNPEWKYLVFSGRIIREKGIVELIQAFHRFTDEFPDTNYRLLVVGWYNSKGFQKEVEQLVAGNPKIIFLGYFKDVRNILNVTDSLILPSYYSEGVPRALTEALCMEIPVITTTNKGCTETCNLKNGFLVAPKSVDELFEAIKKFSKLSNNEKNNMRLESYRLFNEKYDSNIIFSQILEEVERKYPNLNTRNNKNSVIKKEFNSDSNLPSFKKQPI